MRNLSGMVVAALLVTGCGGGEQSFNAAVGVMCATDHEMGVDTLDPDSRGVHRARWIAERLHNPRARAAFGAFGDLSRAEQRRALDALAVEAGLAMCRDHVVGKGPRWVTDVDGVTLPLTGTVAATPGEATVVITADAVHVDGIAVVPLTGGTPAPTGDDARMPVLTDAVRTNLEQLRGPQVVQVVVARQVSYELLLRVLTAIKAAGVARLELVGTAGDGARAIPLTLPTADDPAAVPSIAVAILTSGLVLFSFDDSLGTLQSPALRTAGTGAAALAQLQATLADARPRLGDRHGAVVMADPTTTADVVLPTMAAIRATADGHDLLPDLVLSGGFR